MNINVSVSMPTSLDGFIAGSNGDLAWLDEANAMAPEGEDCGFGAFMSSVDTLLMGRNTYEKVLLFDQWPYGDTPVVVLSGQSITFPDQHSHEHFIGKPFDMYGFFFIQIFCKIADVIN